MKQRFIILSLLIISSPMIGMEPVVIFQYKISSGFVWETFGNDKIQPKYKGEIKNGKMDGLGILIYPFGEKSIIGEWKEGKEWNKKHTDLDGTLIGKFENGAWIRSWGFLYSGMRNGKIGFYTEKWEGVESEGNYDVSKYEGRIKNGAPNGQGTYTWSGGVTYVGKWKKGKMDGKGTLTSPDGSKVGEWKDGEPIGQGTFTWSNGGKYVGEWKNRKMNGQGTFTFPDGEKYVGEYKNGKPWNGIGYYKNGKIKYTYVNGT